MSPNEMPELRRRRAKKLPFTVALVAVAGLTAVTAGYAWADPSDEPGPDTSALDWTVTTSPSVDSNYSFHAVDAISDTNVWAVGYTAHVSSWDGTVAAHWDGKAWQRTPTPKGLSLNSVSGEHEDNVWAVGLESSGSLTAHWDGKAWSKVESPAPDVPSGQKPALHDVSVAHHGATWAVGCASDEGHSAQTPFAQFWDGDKWQLTEVPLPEGTTSACLKSVEVVNDDMAFAVGRAADSDSGAPLMLKWNGDNKKWEIVDLPELDKPDAELTGVFMPHGGKKGIGDVYAAGFTKDGFGDPLSGRPLLMKWTGTEWKQLDTPDDKGYIYGLGSDGDGGVLISGYTPYGKALLLQYDGKAVTPAQLPVDEVSSLYSVTTAPGSSLVWGVGSRGAGDETMQGLAAYSK